PALRGPPRAGACAQGARSRQRDSRRRAPPPGAAGGGLLALPPPRRRCYAGGQQERLFSLYPYVDVAFGPGSIPHLGDWLGAGGIGVDRGSFGIADERSFAGRLPLHRERRFQAWVQISMGCNSVCSYCIVPSVRGKEVSRRLGEILSEVEGLAREGVRELTLVGQNVNSYGRDVGSSF